MYINTKGSLSQNLVFALALLASTACTAHGNGGGGGYYHGHGDGGYNHGGGYYHGHGGYGYGYGYGGPGIVIGVPLGGYYEPEYYSPVCETVRICNPGGRCWFRQECD